MRVEDFNSGFSFSPQLPPETERSPVQSLHMPASVSYRQIAVTALTPGVCFHGLRVREPQPLVHGRHFDHSWLPPVGG